MAIPLRTIVLVEDYPESRFEIISRRKDEDGEWTYCLNDLNGIEDDLNDVSEGEFELEDIEDDVEYEDE